MAMKKAHEVERFLSRPDPSYRTILIYGPDRGLVSERAKSFASNTGVDLNDPFSLISLEADTVGEDPLRLADEANTVGMFGGDRLIWIKGTTRKNLAAALQPILDTPPVDAWVLIEAGDLKKSAALRSKIEKSKTAIALPCYQDEAAAIDRLIDSVVTDAGLTIDHEAKTFLKSLLGGDRLASRKELEKLVLYAAGEDQITIEHVRDIVGDASMTLIDELLDATCLGQVDNMQSTMSRLITSGVTTTTILIALTRHLQALHRSRSAMEHQRLSAQAVMAKWRPMVSFKRKAAVSQSLQIWNLQSLNNAMDRVSHVSLEARMKQHLTQSLTGTCLLALAIEGRRNLKRQ